MVGLGQAVFDSMKVAEPVEGMASEPCGRPLPVLRQVSELDAVVGEHGVNAVRNSFNERFEKGGGGSRICLFDEFDHSELRRSVDGDKQVEPAFGGSHFSQVDVEEADRVGVELLPGRQIALDLGQTAYAMTLQAPVKGKNG